MAGWILVECYVVAYLNPNFTEKQADARDVQEIEHGVCNIRSDENSDENYMWVSIIWKSIIKVVCKIESYMWLWCKSQATYLMRVKNYGRHTLCTNIFVVEYKKMILFRMCYIGDKISESNFSAVKSLISWTKTLLINFSIQHENLRVHIFWRCNPIENT